MARLFRNIKGIHKTSIRNVIIQDIKSIKPNKSFTLPNLNFDIERELSKYGKVICAENNKQVYIQQCNTPINNVSFHYCQASRMLNDHYNFIYLDFCGLVSKEMVKCLNNIISRGYPEILYITVLAARENSYAKQWINPKFRQSSYVKFFNQFGLYPTHLYSYFDNTPMYTWRLTPNFIQNYYLITF